eukprot:7333068-Prymnesium_polylepis.2
MSAHKRGREAAGVGRAAPGGEKCRLTVHVSSGSHSSPDAQAHDDRVAGKSVQEQAGLSLTHDRTDCTPSERHLFYPVTSWTCIAGHARLSINVERS